MKKRLILFLALAPLAVMPASCSKKEPDNIVVEPGEGVDPLTPKPLAEGRFEFSVTGTLPDFNEDGQVRASTQYTVRINWAKGDRLTVINLTTGKILGGTLSADAAGTKSTFTGTLAGTVNDGDNLAFLYPAIDNQEERDFSTATIDMSEQRGTMNDVPLCVCSSFKAERNSFSGVSLDFSYLMCYIMVGLSDLPSSSSIREITFKGVSDSFDLSVNSSGTGFDIAPHTGSIRLTASQTASLSGVKTVYLAVPASPSTTRTVELNTGLTTFSTTFTSAALQNGKAYNTNVSGFLVDDFIPEDPKIRAYCLEHFDTNGDGRLTLVEIAGVKAFPDQNRYPLPAGITSFNELEYFYSLTELPSFAGQDRLESVTIPRQVTTIPDGMFSGCSTLVKVYLEPDSPPALGDDVFPGMEDRLILIVSDNSVSAYQEADGWSEYFNNFRTPSGNDDTSVGIDAENEDTMSSETVFIEIG